MSTAVYYFIGRESKIQVVQLTDGTKEHVVGNLECENPTVMMVNEKKKTLVVGTKSGEIIEWSLEDFEVVRTFKAHDDAITSLSYDKTNLISGSKEKSEMRWTL